MYVEKFSKNIFVFLNWNSYLRQSFYIMFTVLVYVLYLEKQKLQKIKNHDINTEK